MTAPAVSLDRLALVERIQGLPDADVLALARVPEHSVFFMEAASNGHSFTVGDYLFYTAEDWLIAVAYPLGAAAFCPEAFGRALGEAMADAAKNERSSASGDRLDVFCIAPEMPPLGSLPEALRAEGGFTVLERDAFYVLPAASPVPPKLARHVRLAGRSLDIRVGTNFTPGHRRLWSEMIVRPDMNMRVRELYAKTERISAGQPSGLFFLDALDRDGNLAASLLLDSAPASFLSYILGAHSRRHYSPHATDLLFARMLEEARRLGKDHVQLGLGVKPGITRFKRKWGGEPSQPFVMARASCRLPGRDALSQVLGGLAQGYLGVPSGLSKQQVFDSFPKQRPLAMLWQVEKDGKRSWVGGSAHFALYSHERHLEELYGEVDTVLFEGPLDAHSLALFEASGRVRQMGDPCLRELLDPAEYRALKQVVRGPEGRAARILGLEYPHKTDVEYLLAETRPWYAFFSLWSGFLLSRGWKQSVDLEAWNLAKEMGKAVIPMESHEEQLASLESVPVERILNFLRACRSWPRLARLNQHAYLSGNLGAMYGTSTEFPTRTGTVINLRDERFCERMRPFMEAGRCAAFVGTAHMPGMRGLLTDMGFSVSRVYPTFMHRLRAGLAGRFNSRADYR